MRFFLFIYLFLLETLLCSPMRLTKDHCTQDLSLYTAVEVRRRDFIRYNRRPLLLSRSKVGSLSHKHAASAPCHTRVDSFYRFPHTNPIMPRFTYYQRSQSSRNNTQPEPSKNVYTYNVFYKCKDKVRMIKKGLCSPRTSHNAYKEFHISSSGRFRMKPDDMQ